jgi:Flp pilus assembly protein TadG
VQRHERGAVGTLVGILISMGLVFGFLAIAVDVGGLLWERRQLQNAADAAAMSLARECGSGSDCNTTPISSELATLANANSNDSLSTVLSKCAVNLPSSSLPNCPAPATTTLSACPELPPAFAAMSGLPYVEVRTQSLSTSGSVVNNWFAGISGGSDSSTDTVRACARAAVGSPGSGSGELPITISACEWQRATGGTTGGGGPANYYPPPVYNGGSSPDRGYGGAGQPAWPTGAPPAPTANPGGEMVLLVQNPPGGLTQPSPCPNWQGHALPGGFGVLETEAGNPCKIQEYPFAWMHTQPGNNTSCDLNSYVGKVVSVPVFDCTSDSLLNRAPIIGAGGDPCTTGNGSNAYYHRVGYAAFYLSGYGVTTPASIPNQVNSVNPNTTLPAPNTLPANANPCENSASCISGWFTTDSLNATTISGPPSGAGYFGTFAVVPAG